MSESTTDGGQDERIDAWLETLAPWQQEICRHVRALVHEAEPEIEETIKRTWQPFFVLQGNVCALMPAKDHVSVFLYDGAIVPDPEGIITGGHGNKTGRLIAIRPGERLNEHAFIEIVRHIAANNRAGGWRKVKARAEAPSS